MLTLILGAHFEFPAGTKWDAVAKREINVNKDFDVLYTGQVFDEEKEGNFITSVILGLCLGDFTPLAVRSIVYRVEINCLSLWLFLRIA